VFNATPGRFTSGRDPVPIVQEVGSSLVASVDGCVKFLPHRDLISGMSSLASGCTEYTVPTHELLWMFVCTQSVQCNLLQLPPPPPKLRAVSALYGHSYFGPTGLQIFGAVTVFRQHLVSVKTEFTVFARKQVTFLCVCFLSLWKV
jgi:hypothetical protein